MDTLRTPIVLDCWNQFVRTRFDIGGLMVIQQVIRTGRIYVRACDNYRCTVYEGMMVEGSQHYNNKEEPHEVEVR